MPKKIKNIGEWKHNNNLQIMDRVCNNTEFKEKLVKEPKATLEKEFKIKFPKDININILEETITDLYFVLPNISESALLESEGELSESDLQGVAGGNEGEDPDPLY